MSDDILSIVSPEAEAAVDQIIEDSGRLNRIVNGTGTDLIITEDGSPIPSVRKALIDNLYFKTPPIPWRMGTQVREFNQLYSFQDANGKSTWWYAPGATSSAPVTMGDQPTNDVRWRVFLDSGNMDGIYAPILSPLFKGNPRVPTPADDDASQSIANTMWVKTAIAKAIEIALPNWDDGIFNNLTVHNNTVLKNLLVTGSATFTGDKIDAVDAELNLKKINLIGQDAVINFLWQEGVGHRTNLSPNKIFTTEMTANKLEGDVVESGTERAIVPTFRAHGISQMDTLNILQNDRQDPTEDTLRVGGTTRVKNLIVEGDTTGITANVDGTNISPNSINNTTVITTETLNVTDSAQISGPARFTGEVEFLGPVKGIGEALIGEDLEVNTMLVKETLSVVGDVGVGGITTVKDLVITGNVSGLVYPAPNIDGMEIKPSSIETKGLIVDGPTVLKDVTITGVVRGLGDLSIDGLDVKPNSVVTNDLTVNGSLTMNGQIAINNIDADTVKTKSLEVTGLSTVQNITAGPGAIISGFESVVNDQDIKPKTMATTEGASVGTDLAVTGKLTVGGKTTLGDVDITGQVTGINPDFGPQGDIIGKSLTVESVTATSQVSTANLILSGKILDADGNDFALKVDPVTIGEAIKTLDIQPKSVTTKTSDTDKGSVTTGRLTADSANLKAVVTDDIRMVDGTVTGSLKVMGEILDKDGNPVAIMDIPSMIAGKDIAPKAITASGNISTTGTLTSGAATINGGATVSGSVNSGGIRSTEDIYTEKDMLVTGRGTIGGNLSVTGSITSGDATVNNLVVKGTLHDGNGNPIGSPESLTGKDINPRTVTATGNISTTGSLTVGFNITAGADISATGDVIGQDIHARGKIVSSGDSEMSRLKVGTLEVTGSQSVKGSVAAELGFSSSKGGINVAESAVVGKSLTVQDNTVLGHVDAEFEGDRLKVIGNQRVEGNLYVTGVINGNVDISGQDINPRSVTTSAGITAAGTVAGDIGDFNSMEVGVSGAAVGLRVLNSATVAGDLTVTGHINATIDQSQQDVVTKSLQTGNINATAVSTSTLTTTGKITASSSDMDIKTITANKVMVKPKSQTITQGSFVPDGTTNLYDLTLTVDTRIEIPSQLLAGGVGGSIVLYLTQDATGGRKVTFATGYYALNEGEINVAPNGVTVVQLMYSGIGSIVDMLILPRA